MHGTSNVSNSPRPDSDNTSNDSLNREESHLGVVGDEDGVAGGSFGAAGWVALDDLFEGEEFGAVTQGVAEGQAVECSEGS